MKDMATSQAGIGRHIREKVIPKGMSVTEAARKLAVSRPALSKLLNGRAALSPEMAQRLEKAFRTNAKELLRLQVAFEADERMKRRSTTPASAYVPDFLSITATHIDNWAAMNLDARTLLPVLVRRLICATTPQLQHLDIPGFDNVQRPGLDGEVLAGDATAWVPAGRSVWEISVDSQCKQKAEEDYEKRKRAFTPTQRAERTFIFVTARNWSTKTKWVASKKQSDDWKDVQVNDASDLEQWLETTIEPRIWLAEKMERPTTGFQTIESCWDEWVAGSDPRITPKLFEPSVNMHGFRFRQWLDAPRERPLRVTADSKDEAIAFIACLLRLDKLPTAACGGAVLFQEVETLRRLGPSTAPFIAVVSSPEIERRIGDIYRDRHCIVVHPRNAVHYEPDIGVEPLGQDEFETALGDMGISQERALRLARESGRSPTILRRRLSQVDAIRMPAWAEDVEVARRLLPMALVGTWHADSKADREILRALVDTTYEEVQRSVAALHQYYDSPVWRVGRYHGVVSKIDALLAVAPFMTQKDLMEFLELAEYVLCEPDPALELPSSERWKAAVLGKIREHSAALRSGIRETLVLLSIHGNALLSDRLGIDVKAKVSALVKRLLTSRTGKGLESHNDDLPDFAEAAPDTFLELLREDLQQPESEVRSLLRPTANGFSNIPSRTGLLWALERLAWHPDRLLPVVLILAALSRTKIDDNWQNRPDQSLQRIFHAWLPQTAASVDERLAALKKVCTQFPEVGWQVCLCQFDARSRIGEFSARPRWRSDAAGTWQPVSANDRLRFERAAFDLAVSWSAHDAGTLCNLVVCLASPKMGVEMRSVVWDRLDAWSRAEQNDSAKAAIREKIGSTVLSRLRYTHDLPGFVDTRAHEIYDRLEPKDSILRYAGLFRTDWARLPIAELQDESLSLAKRAEVLDDLRTDAMAEIWPPRGVGGALALLSGNGSPRIIGQFAARRSPDPDAATDALRKCLLTDTAPRLKVDEFMCGFIVGLESDWRRKVLSSLTKLLSSDEILRVFRCAPFDLVTWATLDPLPQDLRGHYWRTVTTQSRWFAEAETTELIDRLLEFGRPQDAFSTILAGWKEVETSRLKLLLQAIASTRSEPADDPRISPYQLSEALDSLAERPGVTREEMAQLELAFIKVFDPAIRGIPFLEQQIAASPALFVRMLTSVFRRSDVQPDPRQLSDDDPTQRSIPKDRAFWVFWRLRHLPGEDLQGKITASTLLRWIAEARHLSRECSRLELCDQKIGEWLAKASGQDKGRWPCRPVCQALEEIRSEDVATGFFMGAYNERGTTIRGSYEGGRQEWEFAAKYRAWAQAWRLEYPFVGQLLDRIAANYEGEAKSEDQKANVRQRN